jgi:hypothetical protein
VLLALLATAWLVQAAYALGAVWGWAPNPDDAHYFARFATALAAGALLAQAARALEVRRGWTPGPGSLAGLALLLPFSFPAWWDPPRMDRYWRFDRHVVSADFRGYADWIRARTPRDAVFAAGPSSATWIPVLAGRRVLLASDARPPADYEARKQAERVLLTSHDPDAVRAAARPWRVTHVAIDPRTRLEYGGALRADAPGHPAYERVYTSPALVVLALRRGPDR